MMRRLFLSVLASAVAVLTLAVAAANADTRAFSQSQCILIFDDTVLYCVTTKGEMGVTTTGSGMTSVEGLGTLTASFADASSGQVFATSSSLTTLHLLTAADGTPIEYSEVGMGESTFTNPDGSTHSCSTTLRFAYANGALHVNFGNTTCT
jgi:hypothetical protein